MDDRRDMGALVNAAAFFTAVVPRTKVKLQSLASHLLRAAKRLFGIPDFRYDALADGTAEVCARSSRRSPASAADSPQRGLAPL